MANEDNEPKTEVVEVNPNELPEVASEHEDLIDFEAHRLKPAKIESLEVIRIPSKFAKAEDGKQHKLKIIGEVVETKEHDGNTIEFKPSALIGMIEDSDGKLLGYPESEESDWAKIKKAVGGIEKPQEIIGKELPMKITVTKSGSKFLGFFY